MRSLMADELPCGFVELDATGRVSDANAAFAEWTGRTRAELLGRPIETVMVVPAGVGLEASGVAWVLHADGTERPVLESRTRTAAGELVILVDASERVAFEEVLTRSRALEERTRNRLQLVIDASIAFSAAATETELGQILARTVARAYGAEQSVVFLIDDKGSFEQVAGTNPLEEIIGPRSLPAQAAMLRRVVTISSAEEAETAAPVLAKGIRQSGVHALLAAPIVHDDVLLGVFACFFLHPRQFDNEAAPLADALSGQAAQTATSLRLQRRLEHAAMHDETTGLPNRRLLEAQVLEYSQATETLIAALFIDLDGFKQVNDGLGHHVGDQLLREVGRRIQAAVRQDDLVARYGGDEFVVVCEVPDRAAAHDVAERIRAAVEERFDDLPEGMPITASIGLSAAFTGDTVWNPDRLIRAADHAMYVAKSWGGNRVVDALTAEEDETATGA